MNHKSVIWDGQGFHSINKFDGYMVDLNFTETGGTYFTTIPFSPKSYRKQHPTKARAEVSEDTYYTDFAIYDDGGQKHLMRIPREMKKEILSAVKGLIKYGLLDNSCLFTMEKKAKP